jgi:hypothetical protein
VDGGVVAFVGGGDFYVAFGEGLVLVVIWCGGNEEVLTSNLSTPTASRPRSIRRNIFIPRITII